MAAYIYKQKTGVRLTNGNGRVALLAPGIRGPDNVICRPGGARSYPQLGQERLVFFVFSGKFCGRLIDRFYLYRIIEAATVRALFTAIGASGTLHLRSYV